MARREIMEDAYRQLLDFAGMAKARAALVAKNDWFFHDTPSSALIEIRDSGLRTSRPGGADNNLLLSCAVEILGEEAHQILCLAPGNTTARLVLGKDGTKCRLALGAENLPHRLSLDWSFPDQLRIFESLRTTQPDDPIEQAFAEAVRRTSSVAVYKVIPASDLHLMPEATSIGDPRSWPTLASLDDETLEKWGRG